TSDVDGKFKIDNVETGRLAIEVTDQRHLPWRKLDAVGEDGRTVEIDASLQGGAVITGKVLAPDGKPRAGAIVDYSRIQQQQQGPGRPRPEEFDGRGQAATDASGAFKAEALPPGRYSISARCEGFAPSESAVVDPDGPAVTLQLLQAFGISGIVRLR